MSSEFSEDFLFDDLSVSIENGDFEYDDGKIRQAIKIIRNCENGDLEERYFKKIYYMVAKITQKNVLNFFSLVRNYDRRLIEHNKNDIVIECTIILRKCVEKFDLSLDKKFYFYYNKSLSFGIYRFYQNNYLKKKRAVEFEENIKYPTERMNQKESISMEACFLGFNDFERKIISAKLKGEKIKLFCRKYKIKRKEYDTAMKGIKEKLRKEYNIDI